MAPPASPAAVAMTGNERYIAFNRAGYGGKQLEQSCCHRPLQ